MKVEFTKSGAGRCVAVNVAKRLTLFLTDRLRDMTRGIIWNTISVVFVGDSQMQELYKRYFDISDVSDVISFVYQPIPLLSGQIQQDGEVIVNVEKALRLDDLRLQKIRGWTSAKELTLYLAHGLDHLAGHNDSDIVGRRRMRTRELRWVKEAEREGMLKGLIRNTHINTIKRGQENFCKKRDLI